MRSADLISDKIFTRPELQRWVRRKRLLDKKVVFTNGCFDILHQGHTGLLTHAAKLGDVLVIGVNSDASVRRLKGKNRPVNDETFRAFMLASLVITDAVCIFDEDTPLELIRSIDPDFVVKGGDYKPEEVVGAEHVIKYGGDVIIFPLVKSYSTTALIDKIQQL